MIAWLSKFFAAIKRESAIPPPPYRASKRTATILYDLWYGRLTPDEARAPRRANGVGRLK